jgi:hypothetical protein
MNANLPSSNRAGVIAAINPASHAAGDVSTAWISLADWFGIMAIIQAGALGASATLDAKFEQATSAAGAGAKAVSGKAITQLTKAGSDDNKQAIINLKPGDLDIANDFTHVRLTLTVATAACQAAALIIGTDPRYGHSSASDAATVDEIVT